MAETVTFDHGTASALAIVAPAYGLLEHSYPAPNLRDMWTSNVDTEGARRVPGKPENRELTYRIDAITDQALYDLQAKVAKFQREGGTVRRELPNGDTITFDVLSRGPFDAAFDHVYDLGGIAAVVLSLPCKPYGRGAQITGPTASGGAPILERTVTDVPGDVEAETLIVVTDTEPTHRRYVQWGAGPDMTSAYILDSDSLVTSGFGGTQTTRTGAYDPGASGNNVIRATVGAPVAVCGTGDQVHRGTFRVFARMYADELDTYARLTWQNNDGPFNPNPWSLIPEADQWRDVDLGIVTLDDTGLGDQEWSGRVEGRRDGQGALDVDFLLLVPVDYGYGVARAVSPTVAGTISAFDQFTGTTAGGNLHARTPPAGTAWATSGATTDFQFADGAVNGIADEHIRRSVASASFRFAVLGSDMTDQEVHAQVVQAVTFVDQVHNPCGVILRWVDSSNYLRATLSKTRAGSGPVTTTVKITKVVAGVTTDLVSTVVAGLSGGGVVSSYAATIRAIVRASGAVSVSLYSYQGTLVGTYTATDTVLATGGTLEDGKAGLIDSGDGTTTTLRAYDSVVVYTPAREDLTVYSGRTFRIASHGLVERASSDGTKYGKPSSWEGHAIALPPGDSRLMVRVNRADLTSSTYTTLDDTLSIATFITPRYLVVPDPTV